MNYKERLKDYLYGYSSQYNFKDENDIEHDLNSDIEEMLKQNQKLEQTLDEIENILNGVGEMACYSKSMCLYEEDIEDILKIIQKAKGEWLKYEFMD